MRLFLTMLLAATSLSAVAAPKGVVDRPPAPMRDARFALRLDIAPAAAPERFALDGSLAPTPAKAAPRDRFALSLATHDKGLGACSAGDALFKNGFEN
jgi:hypothetical protein